MPKYAHDVSLKVRGKVGALVYQRAKKGRGNLPTTEAYDLQIRTNPPQRDARTPEQLRGRARMAAATAAYQSLSASDREWWRKQTSGQAQTGYNLFVRRFCQQHPLSEY